jgi:hypothetical protein
MALLLSHRRKWELVCSAWIWAVPSIKPLQTISRMRKNLFGQQSQGPHPQRQMTRVRQETVSDMDIALDKSNMEQIHHAQQQALLSN